MPSHNIIYQARLKQQIENFQHSEYRYFQSNSTSVYTYDKKNLASHVRDFGISLTLSGILLTSFTVPVGPPLITVGAILTAGGALADQLIKEQDHITAKSEQITKLQEMAKKDTISNLTDLARTELEALAQNKKISKRDLLARLEMYDDTTKIDLIKEILAFKTKPTLLGQRFWQQEGFYPCQAHKGTLGEMSKMLQKITGEEPKNSDSISKFSKPICIYSVSKQEPTPTSYEHLSRVALK